MSGTPTETEIKIPVSDLDKLRALLAAVRAPEKKPLHDEDNTLYDDAGGRLSRSGSALRLRTAGGRGFLTWKGPARFDGNVKIREELQTEVGEPEALRAIVERLGFRPAFRYQKRRQEFELGGCTVCLDETPIGSFVEIEGEAGKIPAALERLGLAAADGIAESYAGLYARRRAEDPSLPADMLFSP